MKKSWVCCNGSFISLLTWFYIYLTDIGDMYYRPWLTKVKACGVFWEEKNRDICNNNLNVKRDRCDSEKVWIKRTCCYNFYIGFTCQNEKERRKLKMTGIISTYRNWDLGWNVKCIKFIRWDIMGQVCANNFFENSDNNTNNLGKNIFYI